MNNTHSQLRLVSKRFEADEARERAEQLQMLRRDLKWWSVVVLALLADVTWWRW